MSLDLILTPSCRNWQSRLSLAVHAAAGQAARHWDKQVLMMYVPKPESGEAVLLHSK